MSILNNSFWRSHCILLGDCPGYRSHRMYPFRFTLCRGKEGPSSGQEWLLRWWKCQSQLISGLHTLYCSTMASQCISAIPQVSSKTSSTSQYRSQPRFDLVPNFILASGELTKLLLTPMSLVISNSNNLRVVSSITMERYPRFPVRKWRLRKALSWVYLREDMLRSSSSSCKDGKTKIPLPTKVRKRHPRYKNILSGFQGSISTRTAWKLYTKNLD